ncbi:MAG: acyltransferase [Desulfobacteraceae bacterium]
MKTAHLNKLPSEHIPSFDFVRSITMLCVILYHTVTAYSGVTPQFSFHDTATTAFADYVRWVGDVFMMPVFFFAAGYFAIPSYESKSAIEFIKNKFLRLGLPWLLVMLGLVAITDWGNSLGEYFSEHRVVSFGESLIPFAKKLVFFRASENSDPQYHLWFITLLLSFFIVFGIFYPCLRQKNIKLVSVSQSEQSWLFPLVVFGCITAVSFFGMCILIPKLEIWVTVFFLTFQPTKLLLYVGYFLLGAYAFLRRWHFATFSLKIVILWFLIFLISIVLFFTLGMPLLTDRVIPENYSNITLFMFSLARSFFCLSVIVLLLLISQRFKYSVSNFSKNSYYIYIVHPLFVFSLQAALMDWKQGPAIIKIAIIFFVSLTFSYLISRVILIRYPKIVASGLIALAIALVILVNPHRYEKEFLAKQQKIANNATLADTDYQSLRKQAIKIYNQALSDANYQPEAFELLSVAHYKNPTDYEIMCYLGKITVTIGDSQNILIHMVHDSVGFPWMDKAVEMAPDDINIRLTRGIDSFNRPSVFANRWQFAKIDFTRIIKLINDNNPKDKRFKTQVIAYLIQISEKDGNTKEAEIYRKMLTTLSLYSDPI